MKNCDRQEKQFQIVDPIERYFECISSCDIKMVVVYLGVWKYSNIMKIETFTYFVD